MYADRRMLSGSRPLSLSAALAVNGAIVAGLLYFLAPKIMPPPPIVDLIGRQIPLPTDPPIDKPKPKPEQPRDEQVYAPQTLLQPQTPSEFKPTPTLPPFTPPSDPPGAGTGDRLVEPPKPVPPLISAEVDPRFARDFQPQYPGPEIRAGREGSVTVRVRIGTDGRVAEVQQVRATSPAFFDATRRQALGKWRFRPASRGGIPQESWRTMTVTFVLTDQ